LDAAGLADGVGLAAGLAATAGVGLTAVCLAPLGWEGWRAADAEDVAAAAAAAAATPPADRANSGWMSANCFMTLLYSLLICSNFARVCAMPSSTSLSRSCSRHDQPKAEGQRETCV